MRILTYGATGTQGAPVARRLAAASHQVRALVRNPEPADWLRDIGVEVVAGDLGDATSVRAATDGVDAVVFHLPLVSDLPTGLRFAHNVVDAARRAGVEMMVFNTGSIVPNEETGAVHLDLKRATVAYCRETGQPTIVLRPRLYYEVLAAPWVWGGVDQAGVLNYPLPADIAASWITVEDVAALIAAMVERPDLRGRSLDVGGPDALIGDELARLVGRVVGRTISYRAVAVEDFEQGLQRGLGPALGSAIAASFQYFAAVGTRGMAVPGAAELAADLGVELTPLAAWLTSQPLANPVVAAAAPVRTETEVE